MEFFIVGSMAVDLIDSKTFLVFSQKCRLGSCGQERQQQNAFNSFHPVMLTVKLQQPSTYSKVVWIQDGHSNTANGDVSKEGGI